MEITGLYLQIRQGLEPMSIIESERTVIMKQKDTRMTTKNWIISTIEDTDCLMIGGDIDGSNIIADIRTDQPNAEQNAHMLASAPELYDALKLMRDRTKETNPALLRHVDEALAHAEGRELGCMPLEGTN